MGATTIVYTSPLRRVSRHLVMRTGTVTLSSSYATGGDDFNPAVGSRVLHMNIEPVAGFRFVFDNAAKRIIAHRAVPDVTVTGGQGAGAALQILPDTNAGVLGKTAATTRTIPGATFGLGAEVANATDLSAVVTRWHAVGVK
jgi:hypothetical protein